MKYISLFAGIGGFDLALNGGGHTCVYVNEWDKYAAQTYEKNFCDRINTETCSDNGGTKSNIGVSDGNGGRSCSNNSENTQPISKEFQNEKGRNGTPNEDRSDCLRFGYGQQSGHRVDIRSITEVPTSDIPDHDLLVGGFPCQAFSIAGKRRGFAETRGTLFFEIARILKDKQTKYFILENVKGLLSHDGGNTFKTIISTLTELGYDLQWQVLNSKNFGVPQNRERVFIIGNLRGQPRPEVFPLIAGNGNSFPGNLKGENPISDTITSRYAGRNGRGTHIGTLRTHKDGKGFREMKSGLSPTIPARAREDGSGQPVIKKALRIRRLTPIECERLQGFPDNWTEGVSDTQRYKQLGNAVTVNVVYEIVKRMQLEAILPY